MKFDSYPRFVKSDLYKMCLVEQIADHLPFGEQDTTIFKSLQCSNKKVNQICIKYLPNTIITVQY